MLVKGVFTAISGSLGGITAAHNRGGQYLRARTVPTDPSSARQGLVRAVMSNLVSDWEELDPAQREAWAEFASQVDVVNALGDTTKLSGQNWFIKANAARSQARLSGLAAAAGLAAIDAAPTVFNSGAAPATLETFEFSGSELQVSGALGAAAPIAGVALLYVGRPINSGRSFYKGPYQLAAAGAVTQAATSYSLGAADPGDPEEWAASFVPEDGQRIPVRVIIVYSDGRVSSELRTIATVTTATP